MNSHNILIRQSPKDENDNVEGESDPTKNEK